MASTLLARYDAIEARLAALEAAPVGALALRWHSIAQRIERIAAQAVPVAAGVTVEEEVTIAEEPAAPSVEAEPPADATETHARLHRELIVRGFTNFRFVRCPSNYYDQPLEWRQGILNAASIHHLCKSIVGVNTRIHPSVAHPTDPLHPDNWANPKNSRYYVIIVQYSARLDFEKVKKFLHRMNEGKIGTAFFNIRLAPQDVNDTLSGYTHNAVSPIGMAAQLPIIMSHKITELDPDFFFVGGGEVDLKLGFTAKEFVAKYKPYVTDITF